MEGDPNPISLTYALEGESKYWHPMAWGAACKESMFDKMMKSINKKNSMGLDSKWLIVIIAVIAVVGIIVAKVMGVF